MGQDRGPGPSPAYWLAGRFGHNAALGGWSLFGLPVYRPGQLLEWVAKWGPAYQDTFLPAGAAMLLGMTASLMIARLGRPEDGGGKPPEFGARTWGTLRDARRAGLLDDRGVVLGKLGRRSRGCAPTAS